MRTRIIVIAACAVLLMAAVVFWAAREPGPIDETQSDTSAPITVEQTAPPDTAEAKPATPEGFCERDFEQADARAADVPALREAGGLVYIFEREARLDDPYGCADFYLDHGLDIDAVDPRAEGDRLTGLFYAIKRNDPKMLRFMIGHGADLHMRAGQKDTRPMGYAYYLALNDQRIDRNPVIGILDAALTRAAANDTQTAPAEGG